jgi:glycosyltransferase involved in cell wall biosynthesis
VPEGVSRARNRGIEEADGKWVAFVDDDDLWAPTKLRLQLDAAEGTRRSWAYAGVVKVDSGGTIVGGRPPPSTGRVSDRLNKWNPIPGGCSNVVVSRRLLSVVGGFEVELDNLADWDMWIRLGMQAPPALAPDPLVGYRIHPANRSLDLDKLQRELRLVQHRFGLVLDWGAIHYYMARLCQRSGRRKMAMEQYIKAAARGERRAVAAELLWLAQRRFGPWGPPSASGGTVLEWSSQAEPWLAELHK